MPVKRSDELKDLAEAFNDMTDRIRSMLHTKEQLLLDVSHELRSPLTRMKVALEFLAEGQAKDSLKSDIAEMETMINDILDLSKIEAGRMELSYESINFQSLVEEISQIFSIQFDNNVWCFHFQIRIKMTQALGHHFSLPNGKSGLTGGNAQRIRNIDHEFIIKIDYRSLLYLLSCLLLFFSLNQAE